MGGGRPTGGEVQNIFLTFLLSPLEFNSFQFISILEFFGVGVVGAGFLDPVVVVVA